MELERVDRRTLHEEPLVGVQSSEQAAIDLDLDLDLGEAGGCRMID